MEKEKSYFSLKNILQTEMKIFDLNENKFTKIGFVHVVMTLPIFLRHQISRLILGNPSTDPYFFLFFREIRKISEKIGYLRLRAKPFNLHRHMYVCTYRQPMPFLPWPFFESVIKMTAYLRKFWCG
jgi:hypothetical protein